MAKGTVITLFFLAIIASLLFGVNAGIKLENAKSRNTTSPTLIPSNTPSPTIYPTVTMPIPEITSTENIQGTQSSKISSYTDKTCGFSLIFKTDYLSQKTENGKGTLITDPDDPQKVLAFTCMKQIPKPPVSSENIESIVIDGQPATIYHDTNSNGKTRDEVIVKNRNNDMEIILAGYGEIFEEALLSFRFL